MRIKSYSVYRIVYTALAAIILLSQNVVIAQTATPTSTKQATGSANLSSEVQSLKDRLFEKVSQLQKKEQRVVSGVITEVGNDKYTVTSDDSTVYAVSLDDVVTKYYSLTTGVKTELEKADVEKGDYVIVTGLVEETTVTANSVFVDSHVLVGSGNVTSVDKTDQSIRVTSYTRETYTIDVDLKTKYSLLNSKTLELETATFAKIKEGDSLHYILTITGNEREKNRYTAVKLLIIPQEYFVK